jgi:hypothetical protein
MTEIGISASPLSRRHLFVTSKIERVARYLVDPFVSRILLRENQTEETKNQCGGDDLDSPKFHEPLLGDFPITVGEEVVGVYDRGRE